MKVSVALKGGVAMAIPEFQTRNIRRFRAVDGVRIDDLFDPPPRFEPGWDKSIWTATEAEDVAVSTRNMLAKKKRYYGVFAQYTYVDLEGVAHTVPYLQIVDQKPVGRQPKDSWKLNRRHQIRRMGSRRVRMSHEAFLYPSEIRALHALDQIDRKNLISTANADAYWEQMDRLNDPNDMGWLGVERGDTFNMGALEWVWRSEGFDRADELMIETERLAHVVQERILELKKEMDGPSVLLRAETEVFLSAVQARIVMLEEEMAKPAVVWPKLRIVG